VRDVHATHYGRICPIETPEGPNIGLIASLSTFARVNEFGFVETPYRKVGHGRVTDEVVWLSALEEEGKYIAQATVQMDETGKFKESLISARYNGEFKIVMPEMVELMDVAPNQMVSVAAALVPSSSTTTPTARSWAPTCSARRCPSCAPTRRSSAPAWRTGSPGTPASASWPAAPAWSRASTPPASSSAPRARAPRCPTSTT